MRKPTITIPDYELIEQDGTLGLLLRKPLSGTRPKSAQIIPGALIDLLLDNGRMLLRFRGITPTLFDQLVQDGELRVFTYENQVLQAGVVPLRHRT